MVNSYLIKNGVNLSRGKLFHAAKIRVLVIDARAIVIDKVDAARTGEVVIVVGACEHRLIGHVFEREDG